MAAMQIKKTLLDLNDDCLFEICRHLQTKDFLPLKSSGIIVNDQQANPFTAMKSFSAACKRLRRVASPFVFQGIRIGHDWEWDRVARAFTEILQNSLVAKYARTFVLDTSAVYQEHVSSPWGLIPCQDKSTEPTADIALAFGDVLRKMTRLDVLVLALTSIASRNLFEEHVPKTALKQLSIKRITLGQMMGHGICHQCPQLQHLQLPSYTEAVDLIENGASHPLPSLRSLNISISWDLELVSSFYDTAPQLEVLNLSSYGGSIHDLAPVLARFSNLRELRLASTTALHRGLPEHQRTPLDSEDEDTLVDFCEQVSRAVFTKCKALKLLEFADGHYVEKRRRSDPATTFD